MKRCPECRREYDTTMMFCLDDGAELLYGPAATEEPRTAILHTTAAASEASTRAQIFTTDQTAVPPFGAAQLTKSFDKRLLLAPIALAVIILGIVFGYKYLSTGRQIESIAVMPFVNASGNADVEYLSDGMTETLIRSLSNLADLDVKPRSAVFRYKGKDIDAGTISKELDVQGILTGRVGQRGDLLTLDLELVDAPRNKVVWSEQYVRKTSDLVNLQSEIARDVSTKLTAKLTGAEIEKVQNTYTNSPEAYQLYLKGKFAWNKRTGNDLKQAAEFFEGAIEKDPNYALAYSGLAETYVLFAAYDVAATNDSMPQARAAAMRALEIDESLAEAHTALGKYLADYELKREEGLREFQRAVALKPDYATGHHWLGMELSTGKRFDESIASVRRAEAIDPLSRIIGTNLGDALVYARRYDEGIAQYKRVLAGSPNFWYAHQALGNVYGVKGMYADAIAESRLAVELAGESSPKGYLALWLAKSGQRDEALKILEELKRESGKGFVKPLSLALVYLGLGDKNEALKLLESEIESPSETCSLFAMAPELDDLRSEPRFKAMLKQLNLPE